MARCYYCHNSLVFDICKDIYWDREQITYLSILGALLESQLQLMIVYEVFSFVWLCRISKTWFDKETSLIPVVYPSANN